MTLESFIQLRRESQIALDAHAAANPSDLDGIAGLSRRVSIAQGRIDGMMAALENAERLVKSWIDREIQQRKKSPMGVSTAESEATKQCRLDLQRAFKLTQKFTQTEK